MTTNTIDVQQLSPIVNRLRVNRGMAFGVIILTALLSFEIFNYSTTDFALTDLLGDLKFVGIRWATILAIAFCGIDFAGIARLFTPEEGESEPREVWYLFGAWLLAATMNAMLTWWGVSLAIINHEMLGNAVVGRETLLRAVPIFVAVLVWLIRVLIIGTFSAAGDRLFTQADLRTPHRPRLTPRIPNTASVHTLTKKVQMPDSASLSSQRTAARPNQQVEAGFKRPEPTYHSVSMNASGNGPSNVQNTSASRSPLSQTNRQIQG